MASCCILARLSTTLQASSRPEFRREQSFEHKLNVIQMEYLKLVRKNNLTAEQKDALSIELSLFFDENKTLMKHASDYYKNKNKDEFIKDEIETLNNQNIAQVILTMVESPYKK